MTPLTTAEIEAGLELVKNPELPPLPWASRARTGGDFAGIITSGSRKAGEQVDICYMARGSGRVEGDFITTAANHYESLAAEVLALRKANENMREASVAIKAMLPYLDSPQGRALAWGCKMLPTASAIDDALNAAISGATP